MRKSAVILFLSWYSFGIFCLPFGDFSLIKELPAMYDHCKAYEDKDMSFFDFITDHLVNIDGIFDKHEHGDEQKPHQPFSFHNQSQLFFFSEVPYCLSRQLTTPCKVFTDEPRDFYKVVFTSGIFRPPAV